MAKILNNLILSLMIFFLAFCWMQYYTKSSEISLLTACGVAILCCAFLQIISRNPTKKQRSAVQKKLLNNLASFLTFNIENSALFGKTFENAGYTVVNFHDDCFFATKNQKTSLVAMCFEADGCQADSLVRFCKLAKQVEIDSVILLCNNLTKSAFFLKKNAPVTVQVFEISEVWELLNKFDSLPALPKTSAKKPHIALSFALSKGRFKYYMISAIFMALVSFLSFFPLYNMIWATMLAAIAFYSLFNKRFNVTTEHCGI